MLLHQLKHVNIGSSDLKMVISILMIKISRDNQKVRKCRFALLEENSVQSTSEFAR